ncbi:MAG TPA: response regulator transcription factor [Solirubrobacteraceae bacterium]|jgi:DNA-binding CsgD family transcriptional regulator
MRPGGSHGRSSRGAQGRARRPVLVVKVGGATADATGETTHSCDVQLVRSMHDQSDDQSLSADRLSSDDGEVTAVVILRDATPSRVVSCVRAATRGGGAISPEVLRQLLPVGGRRGPDPAEPQLSDREYAVLQMLAEGESTRGIAERLSYSERTVKNIVRDLLIKLNCKTRAHAVALAARQGVI